MHDALLHTGDELLGLRFLQVRGRQAGLFSRGGVGLGEE